MDRRLKIVARVAAGLRTAQRASQPREWFLCALGIGASVDRLTTVHTIGLITVSYLASREGEDLLVSVTQRVLRR
jgi:hypothetical protein